MRSATQKTHVSRWTAIRISKTGETPKVYELDRSGRLSQAEMTRNPRRTLTVRNKPHQPPQVARNKPEEELSFEFDPFAALDPSLLVADASKEFGDIFRMPFSTFMDENDEVARF
jgi:hypothetical protein